MLSKRGLETAAQLDVPWRFPAPGARGRYDAESNPGGVILFSLAENLLVHQELEEFVNTKVHIPGSAFTYGYSVAGGPRLPAAVARHLNETFSPFEPLTGQDVLLTGTATALHSILGFALAEPGDGILVARPCYGRFELDFGNTMQLEVVYADTQAETCFDPDVVEEFERALARSGAEEVRIRALLIVNPHNPLGRCYPRETLVALMRFCQRHQIHLVSDEVYGLSVFDSGEDGAVPFTSVLSIDPEGLIDRDLVHVEYGTSKDFAAAGLRLGVLVTKNTSLQKILRSVVRFHNPSGVSVAVATAMFEDRAWCDGFIALSRARIAQAYQVATRGLRDLGIEYLRGSNAGFFVWVDLSPYLPPADARSQLERESALAQKLLDGGVFLHPGEEHALKAGWFRMVYTQPEAVVLEGLRRLGSVIKGLQW